MFGQRQPFITIVISRWLRVFLYFESFMKNIIFESLEVGICLVQDNKK